ncbi:MAG: transporter [Acetobacteraceae bacterium]|nr:transporter [Acetobacteraceae bacterium]
MRKTIRLLAAVSSYLSVAHQASAAGFQLRENDAAENGEAFAGSASSANTPATVFNNPAGMTQLQGVQVQLGSSLIVPSFVFHGSSTNALGLPNSGVDDRDGGNIGAVPFGFVSYQLTPNLSAGLALTVPFGLTTGYGPNFVGRYQADNTSLATYDINPAIAWKVTDWLSLGAGLSAQYADAQFSNFLNSSALGFAALHRLVPLPDGYFNLKGDSWSWGYNFGALIKPGPQTNIGLSYRSRVQHDLSGQATFNLPPPLSASPQFANSSGSAKLVLPDTVTLGITQGIGPNWTVSAEVQWTDWSQFRTLNVFRSNGAPIGSTPEHYHNSPFVALGATYQVNPNLVLRVGTAFDKTPVSNVYRTARIPDQDRYWLSVGASYQIRSGLFLDAAYTHLFIPDAKIYEASVTGDVLTGHYANSVDVISLGTRLRF